MKLSGRQSAFAGLALCTVFVLTIWMHNARRERARATNEAALMARVFEEQAKFNYIDVRRPVRLLDSPGPGYRGQRQQVAPEPGVRINE